MIAEKLQKKYRASISTLDSMISAVDTDTIESEVRQAVTMELLDEKNPVVNGIELLNHPHRSHEFQSVVKEGGRIAVIKFNGTASTIVTRTTLGKAGKNLNDFADQLEAYQVNQITGRVGEIIKGNFDNVRGKPSRPKNMTPEDFWTQFTDRELEAINSSSDIDVTDFVSYINGLTKVNLTTKKVKTGINFLFVNKYIRKKTKERFDD